MTSLDLGGPAGREPLEHPKTPWPSLPRRIFLSGCKVNQIPRQCTPAEVSALCILLQLSPISSWNWGPSPLAVQDADRQAIQAGETSGWNFCFTGKFMTLLVLFEQHLQGFDDKARPRNFLAIKPIRSNVSLILQMQSKGTNH